MCIWSPPAGSGSHTCPSCGHKVDYTEAVIHDCITKGPWDSDIQLDLLEDTDQSRTLESALTLVEAKETGRRSTAQLLSSQLPSIEVVWIIPERTAPQGSWNHETRMQFATIVVKHAMVDNCLLSYANKTVQLLVTNVQSAASLPVKGQGESPHWMNMRVLCLTHCVE